jgi:hypothetical protein
MEAASAILSTSGLIAGLKGPVCTVPAGAPLAGLGDYSGGQFLEKTVSFWEGLNPSAARIFLLVSFLDGKPLSILPIVKRDTPAFLANSDLLMRRLSRTSFKWLVLKAVPHTL